MYPADRAQTANFAVDSRASTDPLGRETIDKLPAAPDPPNEGLVTSERGGCGLPRTSDQSETPERGHCRSQTVHFTAELTESDCLYLHIWTLVSELTFAREG